MSAGSRERGPRILVLVENLSVPFDRRVWQECRALTEAGYRVEVICPRGTKRDAEPFAEIQGVRIHRYPLTAATGGPAGYLREYSVALWHTMRIARRLSRHEPFDVIHACNPPDLLFLIALALRSSGARFLFDHHDLVPELFESRFAGGPRVLHWVSLLLERLTFRTADAVISTNDSYREVAITRGGLPADRVRVVRSAPDLSRFVPRRAQPRPQARQALPCLLPGRYGPPGRGGLRPSGARLCAPSLAPRRPAHDLHWKRRCVRGVGRSGKPTRPRRDGRVHRPRARRNGAGVSVHRRSLPVTGPEESAQRRVVHEQGRRVHGHEPSGGVVRSARGPRDCRGRGGLRGRQ